MLDGTGHHNDKPTAEEPLTDADLLMSVAEAILLGHPVIVLTCSGDGQDEQYVGVETSSHWDASAHRDELKDLARRAIAEHA